MIRITMACARLPGGQLQPDASVVLRNAQAVLREDAIVLLYCTCSL